VEVQAILARDDFARATFSYSEEHAFTTDASGELGLAKKPLFLVSGTGAGTWGRASVVTFDTGREKETMAGDVLAPPPRALFNPKRTSAPSVNAGWCR
jgi:hypothetical protein